MQLIVILKLPEALNFQVQIVQQLQSLGCTFEEIKKNIPKDDKQCQSRIKRNMDTSQILTYKKHCSGMDFSFKSNVKSFWNDQPSKSQSNFISEKLNIVENVVNLVIHGLKLLPNELSEEYFKNYTAFIDISSAINIILKVLCNPNLQDEIAPSTLTKINLDSSDQNALNNFDLVSTKLRETLDRMRT